MKRKLIVVDISNFIFRAFFAIRPMHAPNGTPVNAVYGVLTMLLKLIHDYEPTHLFIARDTKDGSFRNELYSLYKANRTEPPDELVPQFSLIEKLIEVLEVSNRAFVKYEADDVIGSIVTQFKNDFDEILIASGDKDLMQFVGDKIKLLDTMKDKIYSPEDVMEKMGVYPHQIVDYLSLLGDTSDNIPGVRGIGAKGASKLLLEFKTLENLLENIDEIKNKRAKTALVENQESLHLSRSLVQIVTDIDLNLSLEELEYHFEPSSGLIKFLEELNFKSLLKKITSGQHIKTEAFKYKKVSSFSSFDDFLNLIKKEDQLSFEIYFKDNDYHFGDVISSSLSTFDASYVLDIPEEELLSLFLFIIEEEIKVITSYSKTLYFYLLRKNIPLDTLFKLDVFDLVQAHFVLYPDKKHDVATINLEFQNNMTENLADLQKIDFVENADKYNSEISKRTHYMLSSYPMIFKKLKEESLFKVYSEIDLKVSLVLSFMEFNGVILNTSTYKDLEIEFDLELKSIYDELQKVSEEEINLRSPKQVSILLFEKLGLPVIKKTKTGYSTDSDVLEKLDQLNLSKIPGLILKNRELEKLQTTYIKVFPDLINPVTKKIHTHFNQHIAATGRLSSDSPNLQNIPIRSLNGRRLRSGFEASPNNYLVSFDYSQVELRLLAHFSEDEVMVETFKNDGDIHRETASEIFSKKDVTSDERSFAKAINFGLMYGQTSFGLSQALNISQKEAKEYILKYFTRFASVKSYLDSLKELCAQEGYSITMFGRKRFIPDINADNRQVKSMAERMAINSPIQGSAADIIKLAMINIFKKLKENNFKSKLILQVHDELIFDVPQFELTELKNFVTYEMENIVKLNVPLKVGIGEGKNWFELK